MSRGGSWCPPPWRAAWRAASPGRGGRRRRRSCRYPAGEGGWGKGWGWESLHCGSYHFLAQHDNIEVRSTLVGSLWITAPLYSGRIEAVPNLWSEIQWRKLAEMTGYFRCEKLCSFLVILTFGRDPDNFFCTDKLHRSSLYPLIQGEIVYWTHQNFPSTIFHATWTRMSLNVRGYKQNKNLESLGGVLKNLSPCTIWRINDFEKCFSAFRALKHFIYQEN